MARFVMKNINRLFAGRYQCETCLRDANPTRYNGTKIRDNANFAIGRRITARSREPRIIAAFATKSRRTAESPKRTRRREKEVLTVPEAYQIHALLATKIHISWLTFAALLTPFFRQLYYPNFIRFLPYVAYHRERFRQSY